MQVCADGSCPACCWLVLRHEASASGLTTRTFVACRVVDWPAGSPFPLVEVRQSLGPTGDIEAGTAALLAGEGVRDEDFSLEVNRDAGGLLPALRQQHWSAKQRPLSRCILPIPCMGYELSVFLADLPT